MSITLPRIVWLLMIGILSVRMALFMSYPFLALHLEHLHFDSMDIGIIFGCHYFFAGMSGVFGGSLADRWNLKYTLVLTLLMGGFSFFGLSQAQTFGSFFFYNCCLAIAISTFEPTASMLITANVSSDLHALAFRYRYMAINIGAAIGPLIGALIVSEGSSFSFLVTGIFLMTYAFLFLFLKIEKKTETSKNAPSSESIQHALKYMLGHSSFLFLIVANIFVSMTYGQIFSTLPQILHARIEDSRYFYSILLTINPITVISVCLFFNHFLSRQNAKVLFNVGSILLSAAFLGFHFSEIGYLNYIFYMILFTLAEILLIPTTAKMLSDLAPKEHRGAYLGAESTSYLGFFIGNLVGGWLLQNGYSVFLFCSFCGLIGYIFYQLSYKKAFASLPEVAKGPLI